MKTAIGLLLVLGILMCACATVPTQPDQLAQVRSRVIQLPKQQVWDVAFAMLEKDGYVVDHDFDAGTLLTDWRPMKHAIGAAFVAPYTDINLRTDCKVSVQIYEEDTTHTRVTMQLAAKIRQESGEYGPESDVHPRNYDMWFSKLGRKLGVKIPHELPEAWMKTVP